jgi:L-2,4-diaminobutyrate transaminase
MATDASFRRLEILDRESVLHPATALRSHQQQGGMIAQRAEGVVLTDVQGRRYIDAMAGLWCVNVGYGRGELARAAAGQMEELGYYHTFAGASNPPQIELADRLLRLLREQAGLEKPSRVFFGLSGSDANDTQIKLVRYYNNLRGRAEKKKIISRLGAYHGVSLASASLTGLAAFHHAFDLPMDGVLFTSTPHHYRNAKPGESEEEFSQRLADELEALIAREGAETIAAFIAEPLMGAGGVIPPPRGYFERIQPILAQHDILFIVDEVICGFGRLGSWFGSGHYGLEPDLISMAKGLTSGYFPLSAVVVSEEVWSVLEAGSEEVGVFAHGYTYSGHPVGAAVALANLDILESENLVENAARVGSYLQDGLRGALEDHTHVGEIRGEGLIMAVEFVADRASKQPFDPALGIQKEVAAEAARQGLIVRPLPSAGAAVALSPPLCLTEAEADQIVEILAKAVDTVLAQVAKG